MRARQVNEPGEGWQYWHGSPDARIAGEFRYPQYPQLCRRGSSEDMALCSFASCNEASRLFLHSALPTAPAVPPDSTEEARAKLRDKEREKPAINYYHIWT